MKEPTGYGNAAIIECGHARIRAQCRHLATVVTIQGQIDAMNVTRVIEGIRRYILVNNAFVLDLSSINSFAASGISLLRVVDEECSAAGAQWTVVASDAVAEVLRDDDDGYQAAGGDFPMSRSVHEALHDFADVIIRRRQFLLPMIKKSA